VNKKQVKTPLMLVLLGCLLLAAQALPFFEHRWVEDESWYSMPAITLVTTGQLRNPVMPVTDMESIVDTRPPLMPLSLSAAFRLLGVKVFAARLGEFLAALLAVLIVYWVGKELGDPLAGGIAALLLAADNFLVLAARTARPEAWVTLFASCALFLMLRSHNRHSWGLAFLSGLSVAAACLFHALGLAWVGGLGLLLVYQEKGNTFRSRRTYAFIAGVAIGILPFALWLLSSPERMEAAKYMYGRPAGATIAEVLAKEKLRVLDLVGMSNQRLRLPFRVPLRLPIVLTILASFLVLFRRKPQVFWVLAFCVISFQVWLLKLPNPSSRYYAVIAPVLAAAIAFAVTSLSGRWHSLAVGACVLCIVWQVGGTLLFLSQASKANYVALAAKLREAIPEGHSCYGAMTFQFVLRDHVCWSYDRAPFAYTVEFQKPEYMVLGDRIMMTGSGRDDDTFADTRRQAFAFVSKSGRLVMRISDPFYGNLEVYRIQYGSN
jgi:Dolichyl-phosphate-mannose-protein mannosyltransferase